MPDASLPPADDALIVEPIVVEVPSEFAGKRLDVFLTARFPRYSRVQMSRLANAGGALVDGRAVKASFRLRGGEQVAISPPDVPSGDPRPEDIPLRVLYEDDYLVAIDKPPGMVVHPAKGHWSGTLTGALAFRFQQLSQAGGTTRPGIVHRLDRDTSGVILVAKSDPVHFALTAQFENRLVEKEYLAIVRGRLDRDRDVVDQPIGPHPYQREKMAIRAGHPESREARTYFEVTERWGGFTVLRVLPKTGRTHQIRVHLAHVGVPVLCDRLYGGHAQITRGELRGGLGHRPDCRPGDEEILLARQALHARRIVLQHPHTRAPLEIVAPVPDDIRLVLEALRGGNEA